LKNKFEGLPCDRKDCRLNEEYSTNTCMGWTPEYDKNGKLLNSDPNWHSTVYNCSSCNKRFVKSKHHEEVEWRTNES